MKTHLTKYCIVMDRGRLAKSIKSRPKSDKVS